MQEIAAKMKWCFVEQVYQHETRSQTNKWVLLLPGAGCSWAKQSGGCYMCNFLAATDKITYRKLLPSLIFTLLYRIGYFRVRHYKPTIAVIYNGGSFLSDHEIPLSAQKKICKLVAKNKRIQKLVVESRPEFVTKQKIELLTSSLEKKKIMVAIGLECKTDAIRNHCINKGFLLDNFERAVEILKCYNVEFLTYVLLKPLYVTEKEAIDEAIKTIEYAFAMGSKEIALEAAFVVEGTKMEELFRKGKYKPPWLWSIIEVAKQTHHLGHLHLGSFEDNPPPLAIPHNCEKCSRLVINSMKQFNQTQDIRNFDSIQCECKDQWRKEIQSFDKIVHIKN